MTALAGRRRRSTLIAAGAAAATIALAIGLAILGGVTLYNSTEGADALSRQPELSFPSTPTGLLAAVDDDGRLASLAVLVARPSGPGGSIITVPVSADASGGEGDERLPIAETFDLDGPESLKGEVEILLGLTIDEAEVVDAERLAALLAPVGSIDVDLPADVTVAEGDVVAEAGSQTLAPEAAAAVLTARDAALPAAEQYPASAAVWSAIATAIGDGVEAAPPSTAPSTVSTPGASLDGLVDAIFAGPVGQRGISFEPMHAARNPRGVDVVMLDRVDLALVFGQIAPGKVSAPNPALTFRIESPFSEADLEGTGLTNTDVAYAAVSQLLFVRGNVLSVDTRPGEVGTATTVELADETLVSGTGGLEGMFGPIEVTVADTRIAGVDVVIRLGTDYLGVVADADVSGAGDD